MGSGEAFAVVGVGLLIAHQVADHWVQTGRQARDKSLPGWPGRLACARHVATYTACTAVTVGVLWVVFGLPISGWGFLAGQVVSAGSHYWADRRFTLARLAAWVGHGEFYRLGAPRDVRARRYTRKSGQEVVSLFPAPPGTRPEQIPWDNPTVGTGAYALDQSWHWAFLGAAAFLTAVVPF